MNSKTKEQIIEEMKKELITINAKLDKEQENEENKQAELRPAC